VLSGMARPNHSTATVAYYIAVVMGRKYSSPNSKTFPIGYTIAGRLHFGSICTIMMKLVLVFSLTVMFHRRSLFGALMDTADHYYSECNKDSFRVSWQHVP